MINALVRFFCNMSSWFEWSYTFATEGKYVTVSVRLGNKCLTDRDHVAAMWLRTMLKLIKLSSVKDVSKQFKIFVTNVSELQRERQVFSELRCSFNHYWSGSMKREISWSERLDWLVDLPSQFISVILWNKRHTHTWFLTTRGRLRMSRCPGRTAHCDLKWHVQPVVKKIT